MRCSILPLAFLAAGCGASFKTIPVPAMVETIPVPSFNDAADDPAIYVRADAPEESRVLGTDKQAGLAVYDLDGDERQFLAVGQLNNVDLRRLADPSARYDIAVASNDTSHALSVFRIARRTGAVDFWANIPTGRVEPYGVCLGDGEDGDSLMAAITYKDGFVQILNLDLSARRPRGAIVRTAQFATQLEGCVFDEAQNALFIGEEALGLWRLDLADETLPPLLVDEIEEKNGLAMDVEGVSIWRGAGGLGWIVVSAQGADRFVVYDRAAPHDPVGVFSVAAAGDVDGVSGTDGVDVVSVAVGEAYPRGLLVVQDDLNTDPDAPQNFKLIDWREVEAALELPLLEPEAP